MLTEKENWEMEAIIKKIQGMQLEKPGKRAFDPPFATRTETTTCKKGEYCGQDASSESVNYNVFQIFWQAVLFVAVLSAIFVSYDDIVL